MQLKFFLVYNVGETPKVKGVIISNVACYHLNILHSIKTLFRMIKLKFYFTHISHLYTNLKIYAIVDM